MPRHFLPLAGARLTAALQAGFVSDRLIAKVRQVPLKSGRFAPV